MNHHKLEFKHFDGIEMYKHEDLKWYKSYELTGGNDTCITIPEEFRKEDTIVCRITNDEGDEGFGAYNDFDEYGDLDWSKASSKDYYTPDQQAIIELFEQPFIKNGYVLYGAERNG